MQQVSREASLHNKTELGVVMNCNLEIWNRLSKAFSVQWQRFSAHLDHEHPLQGKQYIKSSKILQPMILFPFCKLVSLKIVI